MQTDIKRVHAGVYPYTLPDLVNPRVVSCAFPGLIVIHDGDTAYLFRSGEVEPSVLLRKEPSLVNPNKERVYVYVSPYGNNLTGESGFFSWEKNQDYPIDSVVLQGCYKEHECGKTSSVRGQGLRWR